MVGNRKLNFSILEAIRRYNIYNCKSPNKRYSALSEMLKQANKDNVQLPVAVRDLQTSVLEFTFKVHGKIPVHIFAPNTSWCLQISKYQIDLDIKDLHLFSSLFSVL